MRIEGTHTFTAQRALVWSLLHNPEIIRRALPGCDYFEQLSSSEFTALLHIQEGPFNGEYNGTIRLSDSIAQEKFSLSLKGEGPEGSIWGEGHITLGEQDGQTTLYYEGELVASGRTVTNSPRLLRTTANALIRQFLEEVDRYIQIQTGIYTTEAVDPSLRNRRTGTIDMQDVVEDIKQNRRTTLIVLVLFAFASLMTVGAMAIAFVFVRWGMRLFRQYVTHVVQEGQQNNALSSQN